MIDRMNSDQKQTKSDSKKRQLDTPIDTSKLLLKIQEKSSRPLRAHIFSGYFFYFAPSASSSPSSSSIFRTKQAKITAQFASANVVDELDDEVTHVIISNDNAKETAVEVRKTIAERMRMGKAIPRVVKGEWVEECWKEGTVLDEEGFAVV